MSEENGTEPTATPTPAPASDPAPTPTPVDTGKELLVVHNQNC